jgi:hypothetical protein
VSGGRESVSDDRFDELSKEAASASSRRQVLKVLGGLFGGALLSGGLTSAAHAKKDCEETGFPCQEGKDCCGKKKDVCCCTLPKNGIGLCMDRDLCLNLGGTCAPKHVPALPI